MNTVVQRNAKPCVEPLETGVLVSWCLAFVASLGIQGTSNA